MSVDDLKRAWTEATQQRPAPGAGGTDSVGWRHSAAERVLPVIGCAGSVGTSVTALTLAAASPLTTRVVECCALSASGLGSATETELGTFGGWRRGLRDAVLVERSDTDTWYPAALPQPAPFPGDDGQQEDYLTVLDVGWRAGSLIDGRSWVSGSVFDADAVVVVAPASVPGMRLLEQTIRAVGAVRCVAAVVGPRRRRWASPIRSEVGPQTMGLLETGRLVAVPVDAHLALRGPGPTRLPHPVLAAGRDLMAAWRHLSGQLADRGEGDQR